MADVEVKPSAELSAMLEGTKKAMDAIKSDNANALNTVKAEIKAEIDSTKKTLDKVEEKLNMVSMSVKHCADEDPKKGFSNITEFFNSVMQAGSTGKTPDKLKPMHNRISWGAMNAVGSDESLTISNPDGGFLVPPAFFPGLLKLDPKVTQRDTGALTKKIPMSSQIVYVNARVDKDHSAGSVTGGMQIYRRAEAATVTGTKSQFEQIQLRANALMGLSYATEEILSLSPISFASLISEGFADELVSKLNYERLWGTGAGQYLGIMNSPALVTVAKDGSQTADTITAANLYRMRSRAWRYENCVWMANHDVMPQLMALDSSQFKLWMPSLRDDTPDMLMGRPLIFDENLSTLGDLGDIVLVDWSEYLEGILGGAQFMESIHVRFEYAERAFRVLMYNDGQPWWRTALTPKKSAKTLSPYITLEARA